MTGEPRRGHEERSGYYLLTWNPRKWNWSGIDSLIEEIERHGQFDLRWSCGNNRTIRKGDRWFLLRQGVEPRGIVACGTATREPYPGEHWERADGPTPSRPATYLESICTVVSETPVIPRDALDHPPYNTVNWRTQIGGISIPNEVGDLLWGAMHDYVDGKAVPLPQQVSDPGTYPEGAVRSVVVNAYERNPRARRACLDRHGECCQVCRVDFRAVYGELPRQPIEVHHIKPLSTVRSGHRIDPVKDLVPVCPNCHAVIHSRPEPYSVQEVRKMMANARRRRSRR